MLRGTNRSIIEINETGNKYFEKVLIFVKPEFYADPADHLKKEAVDLIAAYRPSPYGSAFCVPTAKKRRKRKIPLFYILPTAVTAAALWLLFKLVF